MRQGRRIRVYTDVLVAGPGRSTVTLSRRARVNEQANVHANRPAKKKPTEYQLLLEGSVYTTMLEFTAKLYSSAAIAILSISINSSCE